MEQTNDLPDGIFFERPKEGTPEFVKGKLSFNVNRFIMYLEKHKNEKGYVNLDLLKSKGGKLYLKLNNYKPKKKEELEQI